MEALSVKQRETRTFTKGIPAVIGVCAAFGLTCQAVPAAVTLRPLTHSSI